MEGGIAAVIDQIISGAISTSNGHVIIDVLYKYAGPATSAQSTLDIYYGEDGLFVNSVKVAAEVGTGILVAGAIMEFLPLALASSGAVLVGVAFAGGVASSFLWTYAGSLVTEQVLDFFSGSADVDISLRIGNQTVGGVIFPALGAEEELGRIRDLLDYLVGEDLTLTEGHRIVVDKPGVLSSSAQEYILKEGNFLETMASAIGIDELAFMDWGWAKDRNGDARQNGDIMMYHSMSSMTVFQMESEVAVLVDRGGQMTMISVPFTQVYIEGMLEPEADQDFVAMFGSAGADDLHIQVASGVVFAGAGGDQIIGSFGDDVIYGDFVDHASSVGGADTIDASYGDDLVFAGAGDDRVEGGRGDDRALGDAGDDTIVGGEGIDLIEGGAGADTLAGNDYFILSDGTILLDQPVLSDGSVDTLVGGDGADTYIVSSTGDFVGTDWQSSQTNEDPAESFDLFLITDYIWGAIEDYSIRSVFQDADVIEDDGSSDAVTIHLTSSEGGGFPESETATLGDLSFEFVSDLAGGSLYAAEELPISLWLVGGALHVLQSVATEYGSNVMGYWVGYDVLATILDFASGDFGIDLSDAPPSGDPGTDDDLPGTSEDDDLDGGRGDDSIQGGDGDDLISGGEGTDVLSGDAGADEITGNNGDDQILGGDGNDRLGGSFGDDVADGGAGNDGLEGGYGADQLAGGAGADRLSGDEGNDTIDGGTGEDTAEFSGAAGRYVATAQAGGAILVVDLLGRFGSDTLTSVESLSFRDRTIAASGISAYLEVSGTGEAESLEGGLGSDWIRAGAGDDYVAGAEGNDAIEGGAGNDSLEGQDGDDSLIAGDGDDYLAGGLGNDYLHGGAGVDWATYWSAGAGLTIDLYRGTASGQGSDRLVDVENVWGSAFVDEISGGSGANQLYGAAGDDVIADIFGGDDYLNGGDGNDVLGSRYGNDILVGEAGADIFQFGAWHDHDRVEDFGEGDAVEVLGGVFSNFDEVLAAASEAWGSTVITTADGSTLTLVGVSLASLGASDFLFSA